MDSNTQKRTSEYIVIPAKVRFDKTLPAAAKLLYGEIAALCNNEKGYCWAQNTYFAELLGCGTASVSRWLAALAKAGYISVCLIKNEKDVIVKRRIYNVFVCEDFNNLHNAENAMGEGVCQKKHTDGLSADSAGISGVIKNDNTPVMSNAVESMTITITKPVRENDKLGGVIKNDNTSYQKRYHPLIKNDNTRVIKNDNTLNRISNYNIYNNKSLLLSNNNNARVRVTAEEFDDYFSIPKAACCFQCADGYSIVREYLLKEINGDRLSLGEIRGEDICNYVQSLYTVDYKRHRYRRKHITDLDAYLRGVKNTMETEV